MSAVAAVGFTPRELASARLAGARIQLAEAEKNVAKYEGVAREFAELRVTRWRVHVAKLESLCGKEEVK